MTLIERLTVMAQSDRFHANTRAAAFDAAAELSSLTAEVERLTASNERIQTLHEGLMKDAEKRYERMYAEALAASKEVERLRAALRECNCPRPINAATDESTAWCVDNGYCGCGRNVLLSVEKGRGYAATKEAGNG